MSSVSGAFRRTIYEACKRVRCYMGLGKKFLFTSRWSFGGILDGDGELEISSSRCFTCVSLVGLFVSELGRVEIEFVEFFRHFVSDEKKAIIFRWNFFCR